MSEMRDKSKTGDYFDGIVNKQRGLLTKEERYVVALKKEADQAELAVQNHVKVVADQIKRGKDLEEYAKKARVTFEKAKAELEAKSA